MSLLFLVAWSFLGFSYFVYLWTNCIEIPNKDKYRLIVLFSGPIVWTFKIGEFVWSAIKPLFKAIDEWAKKE